MLPPQTCSIFLVRLLTPSVEDFVFMFDELLNDLKGQTHNFDFLAMDYTIYLSYLAKYQVNQIISFQVMNF